MSTRYFHIEEILYESELTLIYKATRKSDNHRIIVKSCKHPEDSHLLKSAYEILKDKGIQGIANVIALIYEDDKPYLILEDKDAVVMDSYVEAEGMDEKRFIVIARNAANALGNIHEKGILHKDIKPANMLIDPETLDIYFIDFGVSALINSKNNTSKGCLKGTIEYISPEQTGRINAKIDFRSDLYSLGVAFYKLITSRLPFDGKSDIEIIHSHIAVPPEAPSNFVNINQIVSDIILKLLKKAPNERYQSAKSLEYDLANCIKPIIENLPVPSFILGESDILLNFDLSNKLYGKEKELLSLKQIFDRASISRGELIILEELPSSGKDLLMDEFEKYIHENNGYLIRAEFVENDNNPFYVIVEAFEKFYKFIRNKNQDLTPLRESIINSFGSNGQAIINLFPFMGPFMGKQQPLMNLSFIENQKRTEQAFNTLIRIFSNPTNPIVFFLDNIQWADYFSLQLFFSSISSSTTKNCLVIWSRRTDKAINDEVSSILGKLEKCSFKTSIVKISYLNIYDVHSIVRDIFQTSYDITKELADYTFEVTGGKPLEVTRFLRTLYESGIIKYNGTDTWFWEIDQVKSANVDLDMDKEFISTVNKLGDEARKTLLFMSCCGSEFTFEYINTCSGDKIDEKEFSKTIRCLIKNKILNYDAVSGVLSFMNSRFHKLCHDMIEPQNLTKAHYAIGKNLLEKYYDDKKALNEYCSQIADHYHSAADIPLQDKERAILPELNLMAGNKALNNSAASQAMKYYERGIEFLGYNPFEENYDLAFELYLNITDCSFSLGKIALAQEVFDMISLNVTNSNDRYTIVNKKLEQYCSVFDHHSTIKVGFDYLKDSGLLLDERVDNTLTIKAEYRKFLENLEKEDVDCFVDRNYATDQTLLRNGSVLSFLTVSLFLSNHKYGNYYIYKTFNLVYEHGLFYHFEKVFELAAVRRANLNEPERAEKIINVCLQYAENHNTPKASIYMYYGTSVSHWIHPLANTFDVYKRAKNWAMNEGNTYVSCLSDVIFLDACAYQGINLTSYLQKVEIAIEYAKKVGNDYSTLLLSSVHRQYAKCLLGRTFSSDSFDDKNFKEEDFLKTSADSKAILAYYYSYKLQALCLHKHYEQALAIIELLKLLKGAVSATLPIVQNNFYHSHALITLCLKYPHRKQEYKDIIIENQKILEAWSKRCPENFLHKYLINENGLKRLVYDGFEIFTGLSQIKELIRKSGFNIDGTILEEAIFRYWTKLDISEYANYHKNNLYNMYKALDAHVKVWQNSSASLPSPYQNSYSSQSASSNYLASRAFNRNLDAETILEIMNSLTHDLNITSICNRFLSIVMRNSGANKGLIAILNEERIILEAVEYSEVHSDNIKTSMLPTFIEDVSTKAIPSEIIATVLAKCTSVVINSSDDDYRFSFDTYIREHQPQSFICLPIVCKNKAIGAVCLENAKLRGVFSDERFHLINALIMQSAVVIQNAIYHNELSAYANTVELRLKEHIGNLNSLIAGVAHEINSPIGVCVTVISRMKEMSEEVVAKFKVAKLSKSKLLDFLDETEKGLIIAIANVNRAAELIQNFKKVSVDQSTEVFEDLNLKQTLNNIIEYTRPAIKKRIQNIVVKGPDNLIIHSCSGILTQIFTNLIMNACIHAFDEMDKNDSSVSINFSVSDKIVRIIFTDNGKGMSEDQLSKLFQPFYTTKRNQGGSGLGTHIILTLVTQTLNGTINCISSLGKGTSFIIDLPISKS